MLITLKDDAPSYTCTIVKTYVAEFKHGQTSVVDEHRSGRPKYVVTTQDHIVDDVLNKDKCLTTRYRAETTEINFSTVCRIVSRYLVSSPLL